MPTTEVRPLDQSEVEQIEARANAATKGPWIVWDSCSWRRIGTVQPYADGNVICPITQNDGHPDLLARREDLEFVVHARTDIPALCATVNALRTALNDLLGELEERTNEREMWRGRYDEELREHSETQVHLAQIELERDQLKASRRVHELDNHHNALACGYCSGPLKDELLRLREQQKQLTPPQ